MKKIVIAIDGHASCGKSTFAKRIAQQMGYLYVDSGAMYRAITLALLHRNAIVDGQIDTDILTQVLDNCTVSFRLNADTHLPETLLNGEVVEHEIRTPQVAAHVSQVAALPEVRQLMVRQQQDTHLLLAAEESGEACPHRASETRPARSVREALSAHVGS